MRPGIGTTPLTRLTRASYSSSSLVLASTRRRARLPPRTTTTTPRTFYADAKQRLVALEERANAAPHNASAQAEFVRELLRNGRADLALIRRNSGLFANSGAGLEGLLRDAELQMAAERARQAAAASSSVAPSYFGTAPNHSGSAYYPNYPPPLDASAGATMASSSMYGVPAAQQLLIGTRENPVAVEMVPASFKDRFQQSLGAIIPMLVFLGFAGYFINSPQTSGGMGGGIRGPGAGSSPFGGFFQKNYEVAPVEGEERKTFADVKGLKETKQELEEVVAFLKNPAHFTRLGGKLPRGILLSGPPGTGKTLLAKAVAGEAGVPFFYASGSEFEEMFVGLGAKRVRELFDAARRKAPCIVFIDEIDAIGATRHLREQQAMKMTLNQLLVEIDGFNSSQGVIVLAATNLPEVLDEALVRPGRFDRTIAVPLPDVAGRREILDYYLAKVPRGKDVDVDTLARGTTGMAGADLANLVNVAALQAATHDADIVTHGDLEEALDRVMMGSERRSAIIPVEVRKITAYHEASHALVALRTEGSMAVHKATIVPRGHALGLVQQLPDEKDMMSVSKKQMLATIDICMAGRVGEELFFGAENVTSGASSDLLKATKIARDMVSSYGMTSVGFQVAQEKDLSPETKRMIDSEVRAMLDASYTRVKNLLLHNKKDLEAIALALLERETLTAEDMRKLIS